MTYDKFIEYTNNPELFLKKENEKELKELVQKYPYFHIGNWMYIRLLKECNSIYYEKELPKVALHASDRYRLYFYVHPEELRPKSRERSIGNAGSYFDMVEKVRHKKNNSESTENSLKSLAQKLKKARESILDSQIVENKTVEKEKLNEEKAKLYIKQKRYLEAIDVLEKLKNLNNSKKSVYFADQIRFLKKIIENQ